MNDSPPVEVSLAWLLDLERLDRDLFVAPSPHYVGRQNLFGGQVAAQALMAASRTVRDDHLPHSLHLYFMRPGIIGRPLVLYVSRVRDGRSFTTRNVIAQQDGEAILTMAASFHRHEPGELAYERPMPGVSAPEAVPTTVPSHDRSSALERYGYVPTETIPIPSPDPTGDLSASRARHWVKTSEALGDDPRLHACALTYLSDTHTGTATLAATGRPVSDFMMTSLDHALHFHRHVRADEWLLVDGEAVVLVNSRAMARLTIHSRDGVLGATVQQELLMRERTPDRPALLAADPDHL